MFRTKPLGIRNLGQTCWLNSYLQIFFHCPPFRRYLINHLNDNENLEWLYILLIEFLNPKEVDYDLDRKKYYVDDKSEIRPYKLIKLLTRQNLIQGTGRQYDSRDQFFKFLTIINMIDPNFRNLYQVLLDINDDNIRVADSLLVSSYENNQKLEDLINEQDYSIRALNDVLFIQLNPSNINYVIQYPYILDEKKIKPDEEYPHLYILRGMLVYSGNDHSGGHWEALVKCDVDNVWRKLNDSQVVKIDDINNILSHPNVKMLCYVKDTEDNTNEKI